MTSTLPSIHRAVCDPHLSLDTVEAILWEDPSCLNSANPQNGFTPLHAAARRAHSGLIQLLIKSGASLEAQWRNGETAFLMACKVNFSGCEYHFSLFPRLGRSGNKANAPSIVWTPDPSSCSQKGLGLGPAVKKSFLYFLTRVSYLRTALKC